MEIGSKIEAMIAVIVVLIAGLSSTQVIVWQVQRLLYTSATAAYGVWNFTGYQGAQSLIGLIPFLWVAMIVIFAAVALFSIARA